MSSQNHRPGARIALSPVAYAKEKLKMVDNLEQQLNQLANTKSDEEASRLRMRLCEVVSDIILTEPQFAQRHDCVGRLWRSCFYAPIGVLRKRKAKEQRKKGPNVGRYETSLANFLKEAITLYEYLITQYKDKLVIASNNSSMSVAAAVTIATRRFSKTSCLQGPRRCRTGSLSHIHSFGRFAQIRQQLRCRTNSLR